MLPGESAQSKVRANPPNAGHQIPLSGAWWTADVHLLNKINGCRLLRGVLVGNSERNGKSKFKLPHYSSRDTCVCTEKHRTSTMTPVIVLFYTCFSCFENNGVSWLILHGLLAKLVGRHEGGRLCSTLVDAERRVGSHGSHSVGCGPQRRLLPPDSFYLLTSPITATRTAISHLPRPTQLRNALPPLPIRAATPVSPPPSGRPSL
jgi:hypothetical protein